MPLGGAGGNRTRTSLGIKQACFRYTTAPTRPSVAMRTYLLQDGNNRITSLLPVWALALLASNEQLDQLVAKPR